MILKAHLYRFPQCWHAEKGTRILTTVCKLWFQLGSTAIGIQTSEGVVLAVEKRVTSPLIEASSIEKVFEVDDHIGKINECEGISKNTYETFFNHEYELGWNIQIL